MEIIYSLILENDMTPCKRSKTFITHLEDSVIRGGAFILEVSVLLKGEPSPMLDSTVYCPSIASPNSCLHGHQHSIIRTHRQKDRQTHTHTQREREGDSKKKSASRYPMACTYHIHIIHIPQHTE